MVIGILCFCITSYGQNQPKTTSHHNQWYVDMQQSTTKNLNSINQSFENAWEGKSYEKGKGWKQFKRWEYMSRRLTNLEGNLVNPYKYTGEYDKFASKNRPSGDSTGNWSPLGPTSWINSQSGYNPGIGRVNSVTVDPSNSSTIFVTAASGGAWKSIDNGQTWTTTTDHLTVLGASDIAVDPTNSNIIYLATGDRDGLDTYGIGVLVSKDGGQTWESSGLTFDIEGEDYVVNKLAHHPTESGIVLAATKNGIYKTNDTGRTWYRSTDIEAKDIKFQPNNPNVVYACFDEFLKSTDGGDTFVEITAGIPQAGRMVVAVTPADSNYVYLLVADIYNDFSSVLRSTTAGDTFEIMVTDDSINLLGYSNQGDDNSSQAWYDLAIAASPTNPDEIYTGGVNVWKSSNGGIDWTITSRWSYYGNDSVYAHADIHSLDFYGDELYCGSDGGVFVKDTADVWRDLSATLNISQIYKMSNSQLDEKYLSIGTQDNGTNYYRNGTWHHVYGADGMQTIIDPYSTDVIYVSSQNGNFRKSTDGGENFDGIFSPGDYGDYGDWVTPFEMAGSNNQSLVIACSDIYRSSDGGSNWATLTVGAPDALTVLKVAPSDDNYIYASYSRLIYRTTDGGIVWTPIVLNEETGEITDIEIDYYDPEHIYATCAGVEEGLKVFESYDAGLTWSNLSKNLPNLPANTIAIDSANPSAMYVGMDVGIYYTDSLMDVWIPFEENLPNVKVTDLQIQYASQKLRAATYGRGVWESPMFPTLLTSTYKNLVNKLTVYPNPASDLIQIKLNKNVISPSTSISLMNVAGVEMHSETNIKSKKVSIDVKNLAAGTYFLKIYSPEGEIVKPVIIKH